MVHQGQGLPLGLEAGDDLLRVHAGLDELDGDQALDRLGLLGHPDRAHAAFADLFEQLVRADDRAGAFSDWRIGGSRWLGEGLFEKGRRLRPAVFSTRSRSSWSPRHALSR